MYAISLDHVVSFVDDALDGLRERAPHAPTAAFLIGVAGQFGVRGLVNATQRTRRPTREDYQRDLFNTVIAAWATRHLGTEWVDAAVDDAIGYARKPKPLNASGVAKATTSGVFGNLHAKAAAKQATREDGRVKDLVAREQSIRDNIIADILSYSANPHIELEAGCDERTLTSLFSSLFGAAEGCAVNAEMRRSNRMPSIVAAATLEVGALSWFAETLDHALQSVLSPGEGYVPAHEISSDEAWNEKSVDANDADLEATFKEVAARTRDLHAA